MTRPLTDEETLVLEYIRQHPGETAEDVINYFCGYDESARRVVIANAVQYLIWNSRVDSNKNNGALSVRIGE